MKTETIYQRWTCKSSDAMRRCLKTENGYVEKIAHLHVQSIVIHPHINIHTCRQAHKHI